MQMRIGHLEVRTCDKKLTSNGVHKTAEIVCWIEGDTCYTLASWKKHKEGFELNFVGDRPFNIDDKDTFWDIAKFGQEFLDNNFLEDDE